MIAPTVTWKPWKPVSMKNVEPKMPVDFRLSSLYAIHVLVNLQRERITPSRIVAANPGDELAAFPGDPVRDGQWSAYVIPDVNSNAVLIWGC